MNFVHWSKKNLISLLYQKNRKTFRIFFSVFYWRGKRGLKSENDIKSKILQRLKIYIALIYKLMTFLNQGTNFVLPTTNVQISLLSVLIWIFTGQNFTRNLPLILVQCSGHHLIDYMHTFLL